MAMLIVIPMLTAFLLVIHNIPTFRDEWVGRCSVCKVGEIKYLTYGSCDQFTDALHPCTECGHKFIGFTEDLV